MGLGIKTMLKRAIGDMGYEVLRKDRRSTADAKVDARLLDVYVRPALCGGARLRFVQIGANDGVTEDPLVGIIEAYDVEAVLVEPLPDLGAALKQRYVQNPNVRVEIAAIGDTPGDLEIYVAIRTEDGQIADSRISSFVKAHVERHISNRKASEPHLFGANPQVRAVKVDVITVAQAIARAGWERADVLVIDAEGFDAVIVADVLKTGLGFGLIYFEHLNIPLHGYQALCAQLDDAGYAITTSGKDTLAVLPAFLDGFSYPSPTSAQ